MNVSEVKLANFENTVLREAEQKRDEAFALLKSEKKLAVENIKREAEDAAAASLEREVKKLVKGKNERIVQKQIVLKQSLLEERKKLITTLYENVAERLTAFVSSNEYEDYFFECVRRCSQRLDGARELVISRNDERYAQRLEDMGYTVATTGDGIIGGCILMDSEKGVRIDDTIFSKLEQSGENFLETYNLKI